MNTCAECRFWDRNCPDFVRQGAGGKFSRCRLLSSELTPESRVMPNGGLMTRSDFGCVQFEPIIEEPEVVHHDHIGNTIINPT